LPLVDYTIVSGVYTPSICWAHNSDRSAFICSHVDFLSSNRTLTCEVAPFSKSPAEKGIGVYNRACKLHGRGLFLFPVLFYVSERGGDCEPWARRGPFLWIALESLPIDPFLDEMEGKKFGNTHELEVRDMK